MIAYAPPLLFVLSWVFALIGWNALGADDATPFDEQALRWMLLLGMGWSIAGGFITHTVFAKQTAEAIGWENSGFQYEVGFASLGIGLAGIFASTSDIPDVWIAGSLAGGIFLFIAGINHVRDMIRTKNFAPGNSVIVLSDFGVPISLVALLVSTGAI